jgi:hypothetical protein
MNEFDLVRIVALVQVSAGTIAVGLDAAHPRLDLRRLGFALLIAGGIVFVLARVTA